MNLVKQNSLLTALVAAALLFCSMPAHSQCRAEFSYTVHDSLNVHFIQNATTIGGPVGYFWRFGDGQTSNQSNPRHRYQHPGEYFVELKIQNANCTDTFRMRICVRCVFPGDANDDGIVNNNDALFLGIAFGRVGPVRPNQNTGGANVPWVESNGPANFHNGVNMQYGDCDGDGVIGRADFAYIETNYNRTAQKSTVIADCANINDVPLYFVVPDSIEMGSDVSVEVHLGTTQNPAVDVYGISFSVNYESALIDSGTFSFDYVNSSFGNTSETGSIDVDVPSASRIETAITRIDQHGQTIAGYIGTLSFVMEDNLAQKTTLTDILNLSFADITLIQADETAVAVCPHVDSAVVYEKQLSSTAAATQQKRFSVYPNPANDFLKIEFPGLEKYELALMNILGKQILSATAMGSNYLNTSTLSKGVYFLHLRTENTLQIIKFEVAR